MHEYIFAELHNLIILSRFMPGTLTLSNGTHILQIHIFCDNYIIRLIRVSVVAH